MALLESASGESQQGFSWFSAVWVLGGDGGDSDVKTGEGSKCSVFTEALVCSR